MTDSTYKAVITRDGRWWMIAIPELDGLTQARRIGEAELMAREYIAVTLGLALVDVKVDLEIDIDDLRHIEEEVTRLKEERARLAELEAEVLTHSRQFARTLADKQVPLRDIGELMGVSFQRVSQLVNA
jgi:DNA-directed RNA polymerase specialized sigma subunit